MKYKLIISDKANSLIKQHLLFVSNVSKEAAKNLNIVFKTSLRKVAESPQAYPLFEGEFIPFGKYRKCVISKRYLIIYQIIENTIFVDYVVDTRSDYAFLLKEQI